MNYKHFSEIEPLFNEYKTEKIIGISLEIWGDDITETPVILFDISTKNKFVNYCLFIVGESTLLL